MEPDEYDTSEDEHEEDILVRVGVVCGGVVWWRVDGGEGREG